MVLAAIHALRPHQWVKNLFVLAPFVFAGQLFALASALRALVAFLLFCLASSAVYVLNDLADIEADRAHPVKCRRPIASGKISPALARGIVFALVSAALGLGLLLGEGFAATVLAYLLLNVAYTARLKRIPYIDVLCIATGFELRVLAGAAATAAPPSVYLLAVTFLLAAFLGFGKRMHELMQGKAAHKQRSVLAAYSAKALNALLWLTGGATLALYVVYTVDPDTRRALGTDFLVGTSVFTLFGLWRFWHLMHSQSRADSPTEEMLRDRPFLLNLALWGLAVVGVLYWS